MLKYKIVFDFVAKIRNYQLGRYQWVTPKADLVIEGFPRSANTYLHRIIRAATDNKLLIANHVHRAQQIKMAMRYKIPTFVLFRHPLDCISSYLVREPGLSVDECVQSYINFAEEVLVYKDYKNLYIITFDNLIINSAHISSNILNVLGIDKEVSEDFIKINTTDKRNEKSRSSLPNAVKEIGKKNHKDDIVKHSKYEYAVHLFNKAENSQWDQ
ncbi:hypothetical protein HA399_10765 [Cobetia sp. UIB-001]|uniref:hypothetical protein n=1 Tax=Cobetia sp. UIB-001 TaxID=2717697 RepID=UPI00384F36C3